MSNHIRGSLFVRALPSWSRCRFWFNPSNDEALLRSALSSKWVLGSSKLLESEGRLSAFLLVGDILRGKLESGVEIWLRGTDSSGIGGFSGSWRPLILFGDRKSFRIDGSRNLKLLCRPFNEKDNRIIDEILLEQMEKYYNKFFIIIFRNL